MPQVSFAKGHDLQQLWSALSVKTQAAFDAITRTGTMKLVSPQAAIAPGLVPIPATWPAMPTDDSRATAAELLEVAGGLLLADVPFHELAASPVADTVATTLARFGADYPGPTTAAGLFRRTAADGGPFVSQLLLQPAPPDFSARATRLRAGAYGTDPVELNQIHAGNVPRVQTFGPARLPFTPRALASMVHVDRPYALGLQAAWILAQRVPLSPRFPALRNEAGFVTHGGAMDLDCAVAEVTREAMRQCWYLKLVVGRRRRPEGMQRWPGITLHGDYEALGGPILGLLPNRLLPMVYAEGAPGHSSWPSGHAVIGGAVATLLKAWFADGDWTTLTGLPPQESRDGVILTPIPGASTVHQELNKLAWCYGQGRVFGGIHFRSDCTAGLALGEAVALRWLGQQQGRQRERLGTVSFWRFDGTGVTV
jgi:hypothetical protein